MEMNDTIVYVLLLYHKLVKTNVPILAKTLIKGVVL